MVTVTAMFERVLGRILRSRPRLVEVCAPAGFGKSALLARLSSIGPTSVCDARASDFVKELKAPNAGALVGNSGLQFLCIDGADAVTDALWYSLPDLLRGRNENVTLVLASRRRLPFAFSKLAAPHEIVRIGADDLRLDGGEIATLFASLIDARHSASRIREASAGWPVAALLLRRLGDEVSLAEVIDRWELDAFSDLRDYIRGEILVELSEPAMACLDAAASIPSVRPYEIDRVFGEDCSNSLREIADITGLATYDGTSLRIHPMLRAVALRRSQSESYALLLAAARENALRDEHLRAATLYIECAQFGRAADILETYLKATGANGDGDVGALLTRLPLEVVVRRSALWQLWLECLGYWPSDLDLERELRAAHASESPDSGYGRSMQIALGVLNVRNGALNTGDELLRTAGPTCNSCPNSADGCALGRANRALVAARLGRFVEVDEHWQYVHLPNASPRRFARHERVEIDAYRAFATGRWTVESRGVLESLRAISDEVTGVAFRAALRTFSWFAWICDDETALEESRRLGTSTSQIGSHDSRTRIVAATMKAASARSVGECVTQVEQAMRLAECVEDPLLHLIPRIVHALADEGRGRSALLEFLDAEHMRFTEKLVVDAKAIAKGFVEADRLPVLGPFVARCMRSEWYRGKHGIAVSLLDGVVRRGKREIHVSDRGIDLIACLALYERSVARHELIDALWGHLDDDAASNALKTCVHRTRRQLQDPGAIASGRHSYSLDPAIRVDVLEMEGLCDSLTGRTALTENECAQLERYAARLQHALCAKLLRGEWISHFETRLNRLHERIVFVLAEDARRRRETPRIMRVANSLLEVDPCNERAYELIISSLLAAGNRTEANREYERYRRAVANEGNAEACEKMARLLIGA